MNPIEQQQPQGGEAEGPDSAHQSLADALRASFRILKVVLVVVIVLYAFSGFQILEQNQQAVIFRFGKLQPEVLGPGGLIKSFPRPIDEIVRVPVTEKRRTTIQTQDIHLKEDELRTSARRSGGLDPSLDGSIMTADKGLVHATWIVTYQISDLRKFVTNVYGAESESETIFIQHAVEDSAAAVIGQKDSYQVVTGKIDEIQREVRARAQRILDGLNTGIQIATIEAKTNWPKQTEQAFLDVTNASNEQDKLISIAEQWRTEQLHGVAGASHPRLEQLLDEYHALRSAGDHSAADQTMTAIEQTIQSDQTTGLAGERIRTAQSFKRAFLEDIRAHVESFRSLRGEFERNPILLATRLWNKAQEEISARPGVTKRLLPKGQKEIRLQISPDPEEKKAREIKAFQKQEQEKGAFGDIRSSTRTNRPASFRTKMQRK